MTQNALEVAQLQIDRQQDVYSLDAYAWALYANGKHDQARQRIESALAVGIRDAQLFYHAGVIAARQHDTEAAHRYFQHALELNPNAPWATRARRAIEQSVIEVVQVSGASGQGRPSDQD